MKKTVIIVLLFLSVQTGWAQYPYSEDLYYYKTVTYEIGTSMGAMNCFTDLGGKKGIGKNFIKDYTFKNTELSAGVHVSVLYKYALGLRLEATFGHVKASDSDLESVKETTLGRYERNLSFKSRIIEVALLGEVHPLYFKKFADGAVLPRISPYLLGGVGIFNFKPQAKLDGQWIDLQPLRTEGQGFSEYPDRKPYKLTQLVLPVGIGIKYKMTPVINLSAEYVSRILFTDYLDDVSTFYIDPNVYNRYFSGEQLQHAIRLNDRQKELNPTHSYHEGYERGNPANKDTYFSFNIKIAALL